ncbi:MAG: hypothetical protein AB7P69_28940 [Candidatus Binatia bacterium]
MGVGLLVTTPSYGQPQAGSHKIQLSGGFSHAQGLDTGTATGDVSYGWSLQNPAWQIGLRIST